MLIIHLHIILIIQGSIGGIYNFYIIFFANHVGYLTQITSSYNANLATNLGIFGVVLMAPLAGLLADKFNGRKQIFYFLIFNLFCLSVNLVAIYFGNYFIILHVLLICIYPFFVVPITVYLKGLFDVPVRMRLYGLSHTIGSTILSSTTPLICIFIWKTTLIQIAPLIYLAFLNLLLIMFCPKKTINNSFDIMMK